MTFAAFLLGFYALLFLPLVGTAIGHVLLHAFMHALEHSEAVLTAGCYLLFGLVLSVPALAYFGRWWEAVDVVLVLMIVRRVFRTH